MVKNQVPIHQLRCAFAVALALVPLARPARAEPTDAGAPAQPSASDMAAGFAPDPPPLVTRHQWVLDFAYQSGALAISGARRIELPKPTATPRLMGRFAVELYVGKELIERVRFDFPLLGAGEEAARRWDAKVSFERHLSSRAAVIVPHSERATRAQVVDRASGRSWALVWPPQVSTVDGGAPLLAAPAPPPSAR